MDKMMIFPEVNTQEFDFDTMFEDNSYRTM